MNGKRILHLIHTPRHSGTEILVRDLCLAHRAMGIDSAIAAFAPAQREFAAELAALDAAGVALHLPLQPLRGFGRIQHYRRAVSRFEPDLILAHSILPSFYGRVAKRLSRLRTRFASVLHSATNDDFSDSMFRTVERLTGHLVDRVVAVSPEGAESYRRHFGDARPIEIIPNGINFHRFRHTDRHATRLAFGVAKPEKIILQIGRLDPSKRQDMTIRALEPMLAGPDVQLWLAGLTEDEDYRQNLVQQASRAGIADKVKFLGSRSDIPALLAAADLFVMPSLLEAQPIAVLEALTSGCPTVLSDIAAFHPFKDLKGVALVRSEAEFLAAATSLASSGRHQRDLDNWSIATAAQRYAALLGGDR